MGNHSRRAPFSELWRREIGSSRPLRFSRLVGSSQALVSRIDLYGELDDHQGNVNVLHFNLTGETLLSGSVLGQIKLHNWDAKKEIFSYDSGYESFLSDAQIMPYTNDTVVITSGVVGQVTCHVISNDGRVSSRRLGPPKYTVSQLAIEPGSSKIFYSCGVDGYIRHFDIRHNYAKKLFRCLKFSLGTEHLELTCIAIDPHNPNHLAVGGNDESPRVYDIRNLNLLNRVAHPVNTFYPEYMNDPQDLRITGIAYSNSSELLVSYFDERIYLFQKDMGPGAVLQPQSYSGHTNRKITRRVCFLGGNDEYVVSGSDCGHVFIWVKKDGELIWRMKADKFSVGNVDAHPYGPFLASCASHTTEEIKLWAPAGDNFPQVPQRSIIRGSSLGLM